jgi:hypothetical protein
MGRGPLYYIIEVVSKYTIVNEIAANCSMLFACQGFRRSVAAPRPPPLQKMLAR